MVDGFQLLDEYGLGILNVAESNRTFAEIAFGYLCVDESLYKAADGLLCVVGKRT